MTSARAWVAGLRTPEGRRTSLLTIGPALVVVIVAIAVLWSSHFAVAGERAVVRAQDVRLHMSQTLQRLTDAETGQRGYLLTGEERYLTPYRGAASDVRQELNVLRTLTLDNGYETQHVGKLAGIVERKFGELDSTIALRQAAGFGPAAALVATDRGRLLMDSARAVVADLAAEELTVVGADLRAVERQRALAEIIAVVGAASIAIISILVNALIESQRAVLAEQASELRHQADVAAEQAVELEMANTELSAQNVELETANEELEAARHDAEAANEAKASFLATMSHELRTPLNAISGYVDLMLAGIRGPLTDQQQSDLDRIRRAGVHLMGLINDVLNFAKLEAGQVEVLERVVDVCETIRGATMLLEPIAAAKGVSLSAPEGNGDVLAYADRDKVVQVALNLIGNAIKFTNTGGSVAVDCQPDSVSQMVDVIVRDTGRGIPADDAKSIFEPFVQVGRIKVEGGGGVGLGLAISRELARRMGGDITVNSIEGVGSTFTFRLRRAPPA
ncbi:MAG TPA: CHASE3 domain-containing protein [Gemmatimonadaceae bacterium]|nr:CHASE3 domain-containing protein [Gemmatimonadaceae bacterium]